MSDFRLQAISFKKHSGGDSFGPAQGVKKTNKICPHGHMRSSSYVAYLGLVERNKAVMGKWREMHHQE